MIKYNSLIFLMHIIIKSQANFSCQAYTKYIISSQENNFLKILQTDIIAQNNFRVLKSVL